MLVVNNFKDYEIISMSEGEKLEKWGSYYLLRPDPEIIWKDKLDKSLAHAHYHRSNKGGDIGKSIKNYLIDGQLTIII